MKNMVDLFDKIVDLEIITNTARIGKLSQDFNWYSPILKKEIGGKSAEIVLRPSTKDSLVSAMSIIFKNNLELTIRGGGTGNYGQCVPLNGGVLIDMSRFTGVLEISDKQIKVKSGTKIIDVDNYCQEHKNKELRMFPSTYRSATIGGFFCGGSGGIGSMIYGRLAEEGNVNSVSICTLESAPRIITLKNNEFKGVHHAYGTNGVVVDITLPIEKREDWIEQIFAFDKIDHAMNFCDDVAISFPKEIRLLTLLESPIISFLNIFENSLKEKTMVILLTKPSDCPGILDFSQKYNAKIILEQFYRDVRIKGKTVIEFTWNHTTLHAIKADKNFTYLQTSYGRLNEYKERIHSLKERLGREYIVHLEYVMSNNEVVVGGLPLVNFESEKRLYEIIQFHKELEVLIHDPHVYTINQIGNTNYNHIIELKMKFDSRGLMNSKKLSPVTAGTTRN